MQLETKLINIIIVVIMSDIKKEYDFSKAQRITDFENGKFFINSEDIKTPIYLDKKILSELEILSKQSETSISEIANEILSKYLISK